MSGSATKPGTGLVTLIFASIGHVYAHMFILLYATVVLELERSWNLTYAQLMWFSVPMSVMFGAAALPAGWLGDRWSASGMMAVFFLGVGAASILTGFATDPWSIGIGLTLIGTFAAIYHPVGIPWLVAHTPNPGRALGINGVFGSAGTAGAALVAGALATWIDWRAAFWVPGGICVLTGIAFLLTMRSGASRRTGAMPAPAHTAMAGAMIRRVYLIMAVTVLCTGLIYQMTSYALPKLFAERLAGFFDGNVFEIGLMVTAVYLVSAVSQIVSGEIADRSSLKKLYVAVQLLQLPVLMVAFTLFHPALIGVAAVMVALNTAGQPPENALLARYTPPAWRGRAFGGKFVLTLGVSAIGVAMIPVLHQATGSLDLLFIALCALAAGGALAAWRLPPDRVAGARVAAE